MKFPATFLNQRRGERGAICFRRSVVHGKFAANCVRPNQRAALKSHNMHTTKNTDASYIRDPAKTTPMTSFRNAGQQPNAWLPACSLQSLNLRLFVAELSKHALMSQEVHPICTKVIVKIRVRRNVLHLKCTELGTIQHFLCKVYLLCNSRTLHKGQNAAIKQCTILI